MVKNERDKEEGESRREDLVPRGINARAPSYDCNYADGD